MLFIKLNHFDSVTDRLVKTSKKLRILLNLRIFEHFCPFKNFNFIYFFCDLRHLKVVDLVEQKNKE